MHTTLRSVRPRAAGLGLIALAVGLGLWLTTFTPGSASSGTNVTFQNRSVAVGGSTILPHPAVSLTTAANDSVNAFDLTLTFNPAIVTAVAATIGGGWTQLNNTVSPGTVRVAGFQIGDGCTGACGPLFTIEWRGVSGGKADIAIGPTAGTDGLSGTDGASGGLVKVSFSVSPGAAITVTGGTPTTALPTATSTPIPPTATPATAGAATATPGTVTAAPTQASENATATSTPTAAATNTPAPTNTAAPTATQAAIPSATSNTGGIVIAPATAQAQPTTAAVQAATPSAPTAGAGQEQLPFSTLGYGVIALALAMTAALAVGPAFSRTPIGRRVTSQTPFRRSDRLDERTASEVNRILDAAATEGRKAAEAESPGRDQ
jgi:hypothetical protein